MIDSKETLTEKFIRRGIWLYAFSFLVGPVGYLIKIILSEDLSVHEIGILYSIISFVMLLIAYNDFGLTESLNYFLPKFIVANDYKKFKSSLTYSVIAQVSTSIIVGSLLYFGSDFLAINYFQSKEAAGVLKVFSFFFILMNLFQILNTVFGATQNTKYQKGTEFVRMFSMLGAVIYFYFTNPGDIIKYSYSWIIGLIAGIALSFLLFYTKYYLPYLKKVSVIFEKKLFKKIFSYAIWVLFAVNIGTVLSQIDMQLIVYILGPTEAGYYSNYLSIIGIPFLIITPIIGFLFPVVSELNGKKDNEKITLIKTLFYKYFGILGLITSGFMLIFSKEFAVALFSDKFEKSGDILVFSIIFLIFNFLLQINFQILAGIGKIKTRVKILTYGLLINIPLNLIFIKLWGVYGSAFATGLSWIPIFYLSHKATSKFVVRFDYLFFIKNLLLVILLSYIIYYYKGDYFLNVGRLNMFVYLVLMAFLYIIPFIIINIKEFFFFYKELTKFKN